MKKTTLEDVLKVIRKWSEDNKVNFFGGFVSFDDKGEVKEDRLICYGDKDTLGLSVDEFIDLLEEEKEGFVNW